MSIFGVFSGLFFAKNGHFTCKKGVPKNGAKSGQKIDQFFNIGHFCVFSENREATFWPFFKKRVIFASFFKKDHLWLNDPKKVMAGVPKVITLDTAGNISFWPFWSFFGHFGDLMARLDFVLKSSKK